MSTRALLIRKTPGENTLQWGQTYMQGMLDDYPNIEQRYKTEKVEEEY